MLNQSPVLVDEILVKIFYDDAFQAKDLVLFEKVCKTWRRAVVNRPLWRNKLRQLDDNHAPNLVPQVNVDSLTTSELKEVVLRAHRNYARWTAGTVVRPSSSRRISLRSKYDDIGQCSGLVERYQLLPGGQHLLAYHCDVSRPGGTAFSFSIFHVPTECCIWCHSDPLRGQLALPASFNASYSTNDVDIIVITAIAIVLTVEGGDDGLNGIGTNRGNSSQSESFILVLQARLSTGKCETILRKRVIVPEDMEPIDEGLQTSANLGWPFGQEVLSSSEYAIIEVSRGYMLFLDLRTPRHRWVTSDNGGRYMQKIFFVDEQTLIALIDVYDVQLQNMVTQIAVVELERVLFDAPQWNSIESQATHNVLCIWEIASLQRLAVWGPEFLSLLSFRLVRRHWRGERTTRLTLLVTPEDTSPSLIDQELDSKKGVRTIKFDWKPEEQCLAFVSQEDVGGYVSGVPQALRGLNHFSDISQTGKGITTLRTEGKLFVFTMNILESELANLLPILDLGGPIEKITFRPQAYKMERYSDAVHFLDYETGDVFIYSFDG